MYQKTIDEIHEKDPELALISVGSIEQHGPHLPIMTDWAIATELGKRVAEKMTPICSRPFRSRPAANRWERRARSGWSR